MEFVVFGLIVLSLFIAVLLGWFLGFRNNQKSSLKRICVVVLGDVGRSPRMQYHALSFAKEGFDVDIVGFGNSPLVQELQNHPKVVLLTLKEAPKKPSWLPRLLHYVIKTLFQFSQLVFLILFKTTKHSVVLVQNPPAIPTLGAAWLVCLLRQSNLIIDWHNYGYTILGLTVGNSHPLVKISKFYEGFFGRRAAHNICVTKAMKEDLMNRWKVTATTLYDRPPAIFQNVDIASRHNLFLKLAETYDIFQSSEKKSIGETRFSSSTDKGPILNHSRPALLISSTSWTEDEDFTILLEALKLYDHSKSKPNSCLPQVVCVITGKGPLKEHYKAVIERTVFEYVQICTPWLEADDYPKLVGSADLGICLHTSSSGLDLPMKVVDMFGCGVPVCAIDFSCLSELVQDGKNGLVFQNAEELAKQLQELLRNFPANQEYLNNLRGNVQDFQNLRWHPCWKTTFYEKILMKYM